MDQPSDRGRQPAGYEQLVGEGRPRREGADVYIDPPYGIRYGSNFQPFVNKREVTDGKDEDLTGEPEQIRAFRDTWELGIHSYLAYLRERLLLARELLHTSGSCFVQIGDENVHRAGIVMDEVFGAENRMATISYATTSGSSANTLPQVADYLLWYAKDRKRAKYRQLYEPLTRREVVELFSSYVMVELPDGQCRKPTPEECFDPDRRLPGDARIYERRSLDSQGISTTGRSEPYEWNGRIFDCAQGAHWRISKEGMDRLGELARLDAAQGQATLRWKRYEDEVPGRRINNVWPIRCRRRTSTTWSRPPANRSALHPDDHRSGRFGLRPRPAVAVRRHLLPSNGAAAGSPATPPAWRRLWPSNAS